jgi:hypothetical protein
MQFEVLIGDPEAHGKLFSRRLVTGLSSPEPDNRVIELRGWRTWRIQCRSRHRSSTPTPTSTKT